MFSNGNFGEAELKKYLPVFRLNIGINVYVVRNTVKYADTSINFKIIDTEAEK